ncbi:50S ribosomal L9 C-terminal domain-containing protein, partial [Rhizobium leguminosarum]|uniref:50S ribosomal L9 C-terminal domain-containing protein n=1 Tax=Rhizobium leguminosarum TaxID=384 RepID=UPI003F9C37F9
VDAVDRVDRGEFFALGLALCLFGRTGNVQLDVDFNIGRNQVHLNTPIKSIGLNKVELQLHAEVEIHVELNVARSAEE